MDYWIAGRLGGSVDRWIVRSLYRWIGGSGNRGIGERWIAGLMG